MNAEAITTDEWQLYEWKLGEYGLNRQMILHTTGHHYTWAEFEHDLKHDIFYAGDDED